MLAGGMLQQTVGAGFCSAPHSPQGQHEKQAVNGGKHHSLYGTAHRIIWHLSRGTSHGTSHRTFAIFWDISWDTL